MNYIMNQKVHNTTYIFDYRRFLLDKHYLVMKDNFTVNGTLIEALSDTFSDRQILHLLTKLIGQS